MDHLTTAELIAKGRSITAFISTCTNELKLIDAILRSRALNMPHEPLTDTHREGRRATLRDGDESVTVLFESDILKASFSSGSSVANQLLKLITPGELNEIFHKKTTYERRQKDGHKFRVACHDLLGPDKAPEVINILKDRDKNGITKSKTVIEWV
jgi:hypothetical protein